MRKDLKGAGAGPTKEQAVTNAERLLASMEEEAVRMIENAGHQETRSAWYHSHLGSIDFARQMGLITEERRQQLYDGFREKVSKSGKGSGPETDMMRVQLYHMDGGLYRKSYIQHISREEYEKISHDDRGPKVLRIPPDDWYGKTLPDTLR